ncbi:hypothetical protein NW752_004979 [Fusarium irregulare]|uniref:Telomeric single stranded DNA binding POT1/Cdc13 domain-containing protein n=1 Tax=Fusarium irregulare TaxID=2494466 RepID=A0A9W8PKM9_9HYPO|nr:hypothetical protein NW766_008174 [Fusarium irregulare]KAJ4019878.1 hypothetical protein NW752_004979 [Fusarium irregulare]
MADSQPTNSLLDQGEAIPIAQLNPESSGQENRVIYGTITITWPFSILTKSIAFLLAERDFRLRRENGQVRVRFHGAAAKAISEASLGAGDDIRVSLEGGHWEKNETQTQIAGSTIAWQLEFTNRLVIGIRRPDTEQETLLDIDAPAAEPETAVNDQAQNIDPVDTIPEEPATPGPPTPELTLSVKRNATSTLEPFEYASPAFLKRARVSYGSLFEGGLDMFDDDVSKKTKSKKRSRFSLPGNAWRYASRSPSPEPDDVPEEQDEEEPEANGDIEKPVMDTPSRPAMVDQGSQTADVDFTPMTSVQVLAEARPGFGFAQMTPTPFARTRPFESENPAMNQSMHFEGGSTTPLGIPLESHQSLLDQQPNHMDTDMAFSFTPQTVLFPQEPGLFPAQNDIPNSPSRTTGAEDYPAALLEADPDLSNPVDTLMGFTAHGSQSVAGQHNPFATESALDPAFATAAQPIQNPWATEMLPGSRSANASSDAENPVEILSSSPSRESSADREISPSRENTGMDVTANASPEPTLEDPASEVERYRDGGDEPGDDYDLRKYSRTHDDDDDVDTSEEDPDLNNGDPETEILNPEEDDEDVDEDIVNEEGYLDQASDEYGEEVYERFGGDEEDYEGSEDDAEGDYYSEDEDYTEDEEDEEGDGQARPPAASATREPVFIDLLSDSEDENEQPPKVEPEAVKHEDEQQQEEEEEEEEEHESEASEEGESEQGVEAAADPKNVEKEKPLAASGGKADDETAEPQPSHKVTENDGPSRNERSVEKEQQSIDVPAKEESLTTGDQPQQEQKAEEKSTPVDAASEDIETDTPAPKESYQEPKDEYMTLEESKKMDSLSQAALAVEETTEAMDVDAAPDVPLQETAEPKETEKPVLAENAVAVSQEAQTTMNDIQEEKSASIQVTVTQEESLTQLHTTSEDSAKPSKIASVGASTANLDKEVVSEIQESSESHDAVMQDVSSGDAVKQPIGEVVEEDAEQQSTKGGQISPPPTQLTQEQTVQDSIHVSVHGHDQHLPTPGETQQGIEPEVLDTLQTVTDENHSDEEDADPEDQIMSEILQHSPVRPDTHLEIDPATFSPAASKSKSPTQTGQTKGAQGKSASQSDPAPEAVASKFLRSRRHKHNRESDEDDQDDPSMALITATPAVGPADSGSKHSSPASTRPSSRTRSRTHRDDPSIQLAGGSGQAETKNKRKRKATDDESVASVDRDDPSIQLAGASVQTDTRNKRKKKATDDESIASVDNSPPGSQRVLRSRNDHSDPSILLAKGSSPSTRQTRSHRTPDPKHETPRRETRSVSRSFQLQEDSPDASFASLKSPSIAGSFTTVPEDVEEDVKTLKLRLVKTLRVDLPDFLSLKSLRGNINKMTDVLAVVTQTPPQPHRPKHGPRDFMLTLSLTDPSTAPTQVRVAHIFRPHLTSLPEVESGDVILLRRFKVVSMKGRDFGIRSEDSSSWAVSKPNDGQILSQVKGPPIEITPEEIEYAKGLRHWWGLQDDSAMNKIETASRKVTEAGKENAK